MENATKTGSVLKEEQITIRPIRRQNDWLPEGHDSAFMNEGASWTVCVPMMKDKRALADPLKDLSPVQKEELAFELGLESASDFNVYRPDNYWKKFQVTLDRNGKKLNLMDPYDYVTYRVLQCNTEYVAPSYSMRNMKQTYKFALEHDKERLTDEITSVNKKEKSYLALNKMGSSIEMMTNFMWAHYLQVRTAQRPPIDAPADWLKKEIAKIIEYDSDLFLSIAEDETYPYKVLIMKALNIGALARTGDSYKFQGAPNIIGNLQQMVVHLSDDRHQEDLLKLKTQIEIAEQKTLKEGISEVSKQIVKEFGMKPMGEEGAGIILPEDIKTVQEDPEKEDPKEDPDEQNKKTEE